MADRVLGLFAYPWYAGQGDALRLSRNPFVLYKQIVQFKANPRSADYMKELLEEKFPGGTFVNMDEDADWQAKLYEADTVVLLYPDSIGMGFGPFERRVLSRSAARPHVLNGRRRSVRLTRRLHWRYRILRAIERTMMGEVLFTMAFILVTPALFLSDLVRGKA